MSMLGSPIANNNSSSQLAGEQFYEEGPFSPGLLLASSSREELAENEFEQLQAQREREFLDYLFEPLLEQLPEEFLHQVYTDLSDRLQQTVK
jgi:hypothetical protein